MCSSSPVTLITGSAQRIGASIARYLHQQHWSLVLHAHHSTAQLHALADQLNRLRPNSVLALSADLRDINCLPRLIEQAFDHFQRLDGLVNNASCFFPTPVGQISPEQWEELFTVNAQAPLFLAQAAAPYLKQQAGAIVNISDVYATMPLLYHPVYCAAKAALEALTRSLAVELAPDIRVNAIAPGAILWPVSGKSQMQQQSILARTPLARLGTAEEVAATVHWLLCEARYVSGQIMRLDGGRLLS